MPSLDDQHYAAEKIARFAARFDEPEAYRQLVGYAALPLVLTPELVHYLRQRFVPRLSYVAEVDLLLSELCHESGYETYVMESGVRAAALGRLRQDGGAEQMQRAARLLFDYTLQTAKMQPSFNPYELQAQKWAALAFLDDGRVAKEITEAFCGGAAAGQGRSASAAEFLRLSRLAQELAPELQRYPELIEYAETVTDLLREPGTVAPKRIRKTYRVNNTPLPDLTLLKPTPDPSQEGKPTPIPSQEGKSLDERQDAKLPSWEGLGVGSTWTEPITGMEFVYIPPGRFMMGSPESEKERWDDESPVHEVHFAKGFWMGKYPVTQAEWQKIMGNNPSQFKGERRPVENVSWNDAQEFLQKLNAVASSVETHGRASLQFRLPSEAEWEYACRAGTQTVYSFGDDPSQLGDYAWYWENSDRQTHPVGQKRPNAWGLYDMHGNVYEWCEDIWHPNYNGAPSDGSAWLESGGSNRVLRGGSWYNGPGLARSAYRYSPDHALRNDYIGFRVVRDN